MVGGEGGSPPYFYFIPAVAYSPLSGAQKCKLCNMFSVCVTLCVCALLLCFKKTFVLQISAERGIE